MPYIKTPSGNLWHYRLKGKGDISLLFIHGWAGDSNIWYRQLDYFSNRFKTVALDLPGHGKSDWRDVDFGCLIEDIIFICRELKLKKVVIFGLSFGGQIAIKLVLKSSLFKKLILIDTTPKFVKEDGFKEGLSNYEIRKLYKQLDEDFPNILAVFARSLFTDAERKREIFSGIWDLFSKKKKFPQREALKKMLHMIRKIDLRRELTKIKIPTLIIYGEKDPICSLYASRFLNKHIAESKLGRIAECGHMPFLTEVDKFNNIIDEFLSANDR